MTEEGFATNETTSLYDTIITTYTQERWKAVLHEYDDGSASWYKHGPDIRTVFEDGEVDDLPDSTQLKQELATWVQNQGK